MTSGSRFEEIATLASSGESIGIELKSKEILKGRKSPAGRALAAGIVALANRRGGRILIGINDNTRKIEGGAIDDHDGVAQWISRVCQDRCSPPILVEHEFVPCPDGEVLVLTVPRRVGAPHAEVEKMEGGMLGRAYYVRTNNGKQLATEVQLRQMFQSMEFPEIEKRLTLGYVYRRPWKGETVDPVVRFVRKARTSHLLPSMEKAIQQAEFGRELFPEPSAMFHLEALLQGCSLKAINAGENEAEIMVALLRDAFPYAVLDYLSWRADLGWATESEYGMGVVSTKSKERPHVAVRLEDLPAPGPNTVLARVCPGFTDRFRQFGIGGAAGGIRLPPDTQVRIVLASDNRGDPSLLSLSSPGRFSVELTTRGGLWNVGIPLGHPVRRATGEYTLNSNDPRGTAFASVHIQGSTEIGSGAGEDDYHTWLSQLIEGIRHGFDYNLAQGSLPDHHILRIEMMVGEILERLENAKPASGRDSEDVMDETKGRDSKPER